MTRSTSFAAGEKSSNLQDGPPSLYTSAESCAQAAKEAVKGLAEDLPLLMYGSGDVTPEDVNEESVQVLAELASNYIANLVAAAADAHEIYTDGRGYLAPTTLFTSETNKRHRVCSVDDVPLCAGLDFGTTSSKKPKTSTAISARSFIFPICHDATLYGKVLDIQSARRDIGPELTDKVMMDLIRDECGEDATFPSSEGDFLPFYKFD